MGGDPVSSSGIGDNETLMWLTSLYSLKVLLARGCVFTSQLVGVVVLLASYISWHPTTQASVLLLAYHKKLLWTCT